MQRQIVNQFGIHLLLPSLLCELLSSGRWEHPGDEILCQQIPFVLEPLLFLTSPAEMLKESGPLMSSDSIESDVFSEYRGSLVEKRDLPWIDVERSLTIICNKIPGDDVIVALDYRDDMANPRVIGSDWSLGNKVIYQEISLTFEQFVDRLGL